MPARTQVTADVETTGSTVSGRFTLKNLPTLDVAEAAKPLYAFVGVADLALEQVKDVPAEVSTGVSKVSTAIAEIPAQVRTLPASVKGLRGDVATRVGEVTGKATDLYTELSVRGERLVTAVRRQPATEAAVEEGKEAVRKAEAAAVAAKKSVQAGEKAVKGAAGKLG